MIKTFCNLINSAYKEVSNEITKTFYYKQHIIILSFEVSNFYLKSYMPLLSFFKRFMLE